MFENDFDSSLISIRKKDLYFLGELFFLKPELLLKMGRKHQLLDLYNIMKVN